MGRIAGALYSAFGERASLPNYDYLRGSNLILRLGSWIINMEAHKTS